MIVSSRLAFAFDDNFPRANELILTRIGINGVVKIYAGYIYG